MSGILIADAEGARYHSAMLIQASLLVALLSLALQGVTAQTAPVPAGVKPPHSDKVPVSDTYHGVTVTEDYRWLENADDPKVKAWVAEQNAYTQAYVTRLPQRERIVSILKKRRDQAHVQYFSFMYEGGRLFALKLDPQKSGMSLVVFRSPEDKASERTVVDFEKVEPGKIFQADWYKPSPDGSLVGIALSIGGSEDAALYIFDVATGRQVGSPVPRVNFGTAGGDMAWTGDDKGFDYTRYPQGTERPPEDANFYQQLYHHVLGTSAAEDKYVLGKDFPRIGEIALQTAHDGQHILVTVEDGDGGRYEHFLLAPDGTATQIAHFEDKVVDVQFGADDSLWLLSHAHSDRGELDHLPAGKLKLVDAIEVVPPMAGSMEGTGSVGEMQRFWAAEDKLYVTLIEGGPEEIRQFDLSGKFEGTCAAGRNMEKPGTRAATCSRSRTSSMILPRVPNI